MAKILTQVRDNGGPVPALESYAFVVASTSATMVVQVYGPNGETLAEDTVTVTSTAQGIQTLLNTTGVTWTRNMVGMKILSVATADVFYNNSAVLAFDGNLYTSTVPAVAPTSATSAKIAAGDYSADPYVAGRVFK